MPFLLQSRLLLIRRRSIAVHGLAEDDTRHEDERAAVFRRLMEYPRGALPWLCVAALRGRLVADSAASPMVRMMLPSGIGIGFSKRQDQFIM